MGEETAAGVSFRTIGVSDPALELAGLRFVTVRGAALRGRADLTLAPVGNTDGAPLVILLHGVYGSHWSWALQGGAHRTASRMHAGGEIGPAVLAMPSDGLWGDGSGYVTHAEHDFERWIVEEVPAAAAQVLGRPERWPALFVAGLSMGGFGALRLGAKYPDRFAGISGHSSITDFQQMGQFVSDPLEKYDVPLEDRSVLETILRTRERLPPLRFDCGAGDQLIEHNRALHTALTSAGIEHRYEEFPGAHEWSYWSDHLADTLRFFHQIASGEHR
ncbi:MAG: esterase family protein [Gemmatimonadetes bacterium]|nr:esterase family protein [Gemmatimonadota bacterium]